MREYAGSVIRAGREEGRGRQPAMDMMEKGDVPRKGKLYDFGKYEATNEY